MVLLKVVGSGIGMVSELRAARKAEKERKASSQDLPGQPGSAAGGPPPDSRPEIDRSGSSSQYIEVTQSRGQDLIASGQAVPVDEKHQHNNVDSFDDDEAAWDLDDAGEEDNPPSYEESQQSRDYTTEELVAQVNRTVTIPAPMPGQPLHKLPMPVIIPQRRPRKKERGFVRAYAPVLNDCGISQETFLQFLKNWYVASQASPIIDVVILGAAITGLVPGVITMAVSAAVQTVAQVAKEVQERSRTSRFLALMNQELFMPRGLFAIVMAFKPDKTDKAISSGSIDLTKSIAKQTAKNEESSAMKKFAKGLSTNSGKTYGEISLPEAAPLVFPALDAAMDENGKPPGTWKKYGKHLSDYQDRKARAIYDAENPNSSLSQPEAPKFASRYADPNHPVNNGNLLSFVTGGMIEGGRHGTGRRGLGGRAGGLRLGDKSGPLGLVPGVGSKMSNGETFTPRGLIKTARKKLRADVLYLMVVNLPSEEEMAEAALLMAEQNP